MLGVGIGVGIGHQRFAQGGGGGFDSDYQAILNYAIAQGYDLPSDDFKTLQNNIIVSLKSEGIWSEIDHLYVFPNDAESDNFATINWKQPSGGYDAIKVNSPLLNKYYGFQGVGTSYIDTSVNLSTDSNKFELSSNSISVGFRQNSNPANTVNFGARDSLTSQAQLAAILWAGVFRYLGNPSVFSEVGVGFYNNNNAQAVSDGVTATRYRDGVFVDNTTLNSPQLPNFNFYLLSLNNGGSPQFQGANGYVDHFMSGSGAINTSTFNTIIQTYKTSILSL